MNTLTDEGIIRDETSIKQLKVPKKVQEDISVEAMPRRIFANAHTYHINSIAVNSDGCTYLSADDLRVNIWHLEITEQSFSILFYSVYWMDLLHLVLIVSPMESSISEIGTLGGVIIMTAHVYVYSIVGVT